MSSSQPPQLDQIVDQLLQDRGISTNVRTAHALVREALALAADPPAELDLKIATAALSEMIDAFEMFAPFRDVRKVTIFGSARTQPADPLYRDTEIIARELADAGWMVVTGAGPGIMEAGMRGAGRDRSIGVSIRLPFESGANSVIAGDPKHVSMKYFFTRKLMLIKESAGFVALPGGFGTLDETFELLTLTQTGKGVPVPIVLHDADPEIADPEIADTEIPNPEIADPGIPNPEIAGPVRPNEAASETSYWGHVDRFVRGVLIPRGMVSADDLALYQLSSDPSETVAQIVGFYRNYQSIRFVRDRLVIRMLRPPSPDQLAELNRHFSGLVASGSIELVEASPEEVADRDGLDLVRLGLEFNRRGFAELRALIDEINRW